MPRINPEILVWARETAGLTPEEAVKKLGIADAHGVVAIDRLAALSVFTLGRTVVAVVEIAGAFGWRDGGEEVADGRPELVPGARRGLTQQCLELGEQLLDRVQIGEYGGR